ncbi:hypothetical protein SPWS13_1923 [Shewanella putrefaciens]|nr:hypothetical protein SPWS13_1923 [Shewanella putrefaciens]
MCKNKFSLAGAGQLREIAADMLRFFPNHYCGLAKGLPLIDL